VFGGGTWVRQVVRRVRRRVDSFGITRVMQIRKSIVETTRQRRDGDAGTYLDVIEFEPFRP
jgi:hypothetical protein